MSLRFCHCHFSHFHREIFEISPSFVFLLKAKIYTYPLVPRGNTQAYRKSSIIIISRLVTAANRERTNSPVGNHHRWRRQTLTLSRGVMMSLARKWHHFVGSLIRPTNNLQLIQTDLYLNRIFARIAILMYILQVLNRSVIKENELRFMTLNRLIFMWRVSSIITLFISILFFINNIIKSLYHYKLRNGVNLSITLKKYA